MDRARLVSALQILALGAVILFALREVQSDSFREGFAAGFTAQAVRSHHSEGIAP